MRVSKSGPNPYLYLKVLVTFSKKWPDTYSQGGGQGPFLQKVT